MGRNGKKKKVFIKNSDENKTLKLERNGGTLPICKTAGFYLS
jgi:hypothetical protein